MSGSRKPASRGGNQRLRLSVFRSPSHYFAGLLPEFLSASRTAVLLSRRKIGAHCRIGRPGGRSLNPDRYRIERWSTCGFSFLTTVTTTDLSASPPAALKSQRYSP